MLAAKSAQLLPSNTHFPRTLVERISKTPLSLFGAVFLSSREWSKMSCNVSIQRSSRSLTSLHKRTSRERIALLLRVLPSSPLKLVASRGMMNSFTNSIFPDFPASKSPTTGRECPFAISSSSRTTQSSMRRSRIDRHWGLGTMSYAAGKVTMETAPAMARSFDRPLPFMWAIKHKSKSSLNVAKGACNVNPGVWEASSKTFFAEAAIEDAKPRAYSCVIWGILSTV
mmetsp:Transcript_10440/g.63836  ORF Transcript_10440/g.63836 Transcript_10440/m.63836 type:complete len:227 (-) Transcript_10440:2541-3221(-)